MASNPATILRFLILLSVLSVMGIAIVPPALPDIAAGFAMPAEATWSVISAFAVPGVFMVPLAGILADRFGRKPVLTFCLTFYIIGGVGCALAPSYSVLLFMRVLQGLGSGPLGSLNGTILTDSERPIDRPRKLGYIAVACAVATAVFPFVGGLISKTIGWRWVFAANILALPMLAFLFRLPLRGADPGIRLLPYLRLFGTFIKDRNVLSLLSLEIFIGTCGFGAVMTYVPILGAVVFGADSFSIGTITMCGALGSVTGGILTGKISRRFPMRTILLADGTLIAAAFIIFLIMPSFVLLIAPIFLFGVGNSMTGPMIKARISMIADERTIGAAMSMNGLCFRLAQAIAPVLSAAVWHLIGPYGPFFLGLAVGILYLCVVLTMPKNVRVDQK